MGSRTSNHFKSVSSGPVWWPHWALDLLWFDISARGAQNAAEGGLRVTEFGITITLLRQGTHFTHPPQTFFEHIREKNLKCSMPDDGKGNPYLVWVATEGRSRPLKMAVGLLTPWWLDRPPPPPLLTPGPLPLLWEAAPPHRSGRPLCLPGCAPEPSMAGRAPRWRLV